MAVEDSMMMQQIAIGRDQDASMQSLLGLNQQPSLSILSDNLNDMGPILQAFTAAFSVILISELGDKTFIIAAIMSMENSRALVFLASAGALGLMTILSVIMGVAVTIIPKLYTHYASMVLFLCFGLKMLHEAYSMKSDENSDSEFDEVKKSLEEERKQKNFVSGKTIDEIKFDENNNIISSPNCTPIAAPADSKTTNKGSWLKVAGPLVIQVFTMTFLAEWGDRSQISTVILAAREDAFGVLSGALLGHLLCTGLAVLAGRFVAEMISVKTSKLNYQVEWHNFRI